MPEELERKLKKEAKKKFGSTTSERARKYIYGTLRKTGWVPSHQKKNRDITAGEKRGKTKKSPAGRSGTRRGGGKRR
ncbi:MAG: hypothetical protein JSV30_03830 [Candidatus Omnitrophota bacterium]|nr:MAG: hypothetical protein JSV30_03830 [Candidatus Omnitrophota bacterium]